VFGYSVALSADGSTALVGAPSKNGFAGAAYVFVRSGSGWTQQAELTASDSGAGDYFGSAVALSGDGSTALVGAGVKFLATGAAYVFVRNGGTWTQQQKLSASDAAIGDVFGYSVALSEDGTTALVGAPYTDNVAVPGANNKAGAAYVFVRNGSTWSQQQKVTAGDAAANDDLGSAVALSADGSIALVAAGGKNTSTGAIYMYLRSGSTWSQQQKFTASDGAQNDQFGYTAALSPDGSIALVGAPSKNSSTGAAYVFVRSGSTWLQRKELTASGGALGDKFGITVALSADGSIALVGAYARNGSTGAAYVCGIWDQQQTLTANDGAQNDKFGIAVALSADGSIALVGAVAKSSKAGAAYVLSGLRTATAHRIQAGWNLFAAGPTDSYIAASSLLGALLRQSGGQTAAIYGLSNGNWSPSLIDSHGTITGTDFDLQANTGYLIYSDRAAPFAFGAGAPMATGVPGSLPAPASAAVPPGPPSLP
jgi:hypothetical protein